MERGTRRSVFPSHAPALSDTVSASADLCPVRGQSACVLQVRSCAALSGPSPVGRWDFVTQLNPHSVADLEPRFATDRYSVDAHEAACRGTDHATTGLNRTFPRCPRTRRVQPRKTWEKSKVLDLGMFVSLLWRQLMMPERARPVNVKPRGESVWLAHTASKSLSFTKRSLIVLVRT